MDGEYDPSDWQEQRKHALAFLTHLEQVAKASLGPSNEKVLADVDRALLIGALAGARHAFEEIELNLVLEKRENQRSVATFSYEMLWQLMSAAFLIGSSGIVSSLQE